MLFASLNLNSADALIDEGAMMNCHSSSEPHNYPIHPYFFEWMALTQFSRLLP